MRSGGAEAASADAKPSRVLRSAATHRLVAGPAPGRRRIKAYAGPVTEDRRELIISHGNLINWFVAQALDAPDQAWLRMLDYSCALTVIMYFPDRTRLISYNDMGHLPPIDARHRLPLEARI